VVVGGGLLGLCCAYYLLEAGADVTVVERGKVGDGASRFNAGMVTTCVTPLPAPGVVRDGVAGILGRGGAVCVSPLLSAGEVRFFTRFAGFCSAERYERGFAALLELNRDCYRLYDGLEQAGAVELEKNGYLVCCASAASARACREEYSGMPPAVGRPGPILEGAALREEEPALGGDGLAGFVHLDERWVDAATLVDGLERAVTQAGGVIVEGARVVAVEEDGAHAVARSSAGSVRADFAVIAAGVWSEDITRAAGTRLGMLPGKGYSFSVGGGEPLRRLLYFDDAHVVALPAGGRVRIAGTMEFDGTRDAFDRRRVEAMIRAVRPLLPGLDWSDVGGEWVAPRPMTPDGLPVIGALPGSQRVFVATGHNMLGLTLGPSTGKAIASLVCGAPPDVDLRAFAPGRFARRAGRRRTRRTPGEARA